MILFYNNFVVKFYKKFVRFATIVIRMHDMDFLLNGFKALAEHPEMIAMWAIGGLLIYLAIKKDMEPALLLPMGFGAILVNLPLSPVIQEHGIITLLFDVGIAASKAMPLLLFSV